MPFPRALNFTRKLAMLVGTNQQSISGWKNFGGFGVLSSNICTRLNSRQLSCKPLQQPQSYFRNQFYHSLIRVSQNSATSKTHRNAVRCYASSGTDDEVMEPTEGEIKLKRTIKKCFPSASTVTVEDISGGCGSMYQIYIEASEFKGLSTVKQHRLVNEALKEEIQSMHGIRIQTAVPKGT